MAKTSAKTGPSKLIAKAPPKKSPAKSSPGQSRGAPFDFDGFEPEVIQLIRSSSETAPREDDSLGEYQYSCEVFRNLKMEEGDVCFVEFSATEVAEKEAVIKVDATYMVVIATPGTATRAQRDAFTAFFVKHVVWQRFRDFCDFALAHSAESLPLPLALTGEVAFKTY